MTPGRVGSIFWVVVIAAGAVAPAPAQNADAGQRAYGICATCHGIEGRSFKSHYPILAGQTGPYLFLQLNDFKLGRRSDPSMDAIVPQLSTQNMLDLAAYFAALEPSSSQFKSEPVKFARGRDKAATFGCTACHPQSGSAATVHSSRIAGQHRDYVAKQLRDFREGRRTNDGGAMRRIANMLSDADIDDLANYFAGIR